MKYQFWYEKKDLSEILKISNKDMIAIDTETTGVDINNDEILQISIIDGNGKVLFNDLIKPKNHNSWPEAYKVNHISFEDVKDKPYIDDYLEKINKIISNAKLIIGYNSYDFDVPIMINSGIKFANVLHYDVMREFGCVKGKLTTAGFDFKISLAKCCLYYDVDNEKAHDANSDTIATLNCFKKMMKDSEETGYLTFVNSKYNNSYWWNSVRKNGNNDRSFVNYEKLMKKNIKEEIIKKLELPVTKQLVYKRKYNGPNEIYNIIDFYIDKAYRSFCILSLKLENGENIRIHNDYLKQMQDEKFFD